MGVAVEIGAGGARCGMLGGVVMRRGASMNGTARLVLIVVLVLLLLGSLPLWPYCAGWVLPWTAMW